MTIQVSTDHNIEGSERLNAHVKDVVTASLGRHTEHITRVDVHFSDENGNKAGTDDKKCVLEAHMECQQPVVATSHAGTTEQALELAIEKVKHSLETIIGKMRQHDRTAKDQLIDMQ